MTYGELLDWLYSSQQFGIKLGLENTRKLLAAVGDPQKRLQFIHVAGTNGKGSVCAMTDAVLRRSGRRTGLFTSPHLVDYRERVRVDGEWISEEAVVEGLTRLRGAADDLAQPPTFFELSMVLAARYFAECGVDVVVLETGMGGRLDSTNVVRPLVSVITPIAMDHTRWLGNTIAEIAGEKAGIIKAGVPVVSAAQDDAAERVIRDRAAEMVAELEFVPGEVPEDWEIGLTGSHQRRNAALAMAAIRAAGIAVDESARRRGLAAVEWRGRFQRIGNVVLDGAHNLQGARQLVQTWRETFGEERAVVIFGALADKDPGGMIGELEAIASEFIFVPVKSMRSEEPGELARLTTRPCRVAGSLTDGFTGASGRAVLLTGSLYLVGEALVGKASIPALQ
ncbi:MAG: folylpolyglutamate synthase/dihydrofolate synthase family protein [Chthoniobacterales bacterium]